MRVSAFVPAFALTAAAAFGQTRPLLTEEAATAAARTLSLEVGLDRMGAEPNFVTGRERDRWDLPLLRLVYAPSDNVELDLEWAGRILARADPDFGSVSDYGDVVLRAKLHFVEERNGRPGFGARFGVTLPETESLKGLGPNTLRMSAQFLLSKTWGGTSVHANAGLAIHDRPLQLHAQSDFLAYALALTQRAGPRLTLAAEIAGLSGKGVPGADEHAEARAGLRYGAGRVRWDAAVRRGLADADGTWGFTAGASWTLRSGR